MRSIFTFLVTMTVAMTAMAKNTANPIGTWAIELSAPDGQVYHPKATITKSEDGHRGSYYSPSSDQTFDLQGVEFDSDNMLHFTLATQGLTVAYIGKIEGNKMNGPAQIVYDGQQYDADFSTTREAKTDSVSGTWEMETERQGEINQGTLMLSVAKDGKISGKTDGQSGTSEVEGAKLEDGVLTFSAKGQSQGYDYVAKYRGHVNGNEIKGDVIVDVASAGVTREFSWSANRID